jgi:hypothetical protein
MANKYMKKCSNFYHKGNANQNYIETPPHPSQKRLSSITEITAHAGKDVGERNTSILLVEM